MKPVCSLLNARMARREWLGGLLAMAGSVAMWPQISDAASADSVVLTPNFGHDLFRVRIEMNLEGNVNVPGNALVSRKSETKLPIKSDAVFDYEERFRRPANVDVRSEVTASERFYHEATSTSRLDRNEQTLGLRDSVRHAIVRRDTLPEVVYSLDDYLSHQEVDLLRIPASSITIDQLIPTDAITKGQTFAIRRGALVSLLNLASIEESDVAGEVVEITAEAVKFQMRGRVSGSTDGVPTVMRIVGKLTFDRKLSTTTWLAMAIHETREIGKAEPGFDISATVKMIRKPLDKQVTLPAKPAAIAVTEPIPKDRLYTELTSREVKVSVLMDRHWRMMSDVPGSAMMRMIENDRSIAQCDFRKLADLKPGQQWTLEAFQADVRRTLGTQLTQIVEADERLSDSNLRVLRVTASGAVQGVPVQWVMMHFSDDSGRRVLATFTMDGQSVEAFAGSDIQLANSLRFAPASDSAADSEKSGTVKTESRAEGQPNVAKLNVESSSSVQSTEKLRSPSDRR